MGFTQSQGPTFIAVYTKKWQFFLSLIYIMSVGTDSLVFPLTKAMREQGTGKVTQVRTRVRQTIHPKSMC